MASPRILQIPNITNATASSIPSILGSTGFNSDTKLINVRTDVGTLNAVPYTDGTGASGTWGINISGNAATATTAGTATGLAITGTGNKNGYIESTTTGGGGNVTFDLKRADLNSATLTRLYTGGSIEYQIGSAALNQNYSIQDGLGNYLLQLSNLGELFLPSYSDHSVILTTSGGQLYTATGTTGQVLIFGATDPAFGAVDLANASAITGILPVANGGTGQSTYTNGQLLIGNTTGNTLTKATLTGTANQVVVTNGTGSITLSLPQNIATTSSPTFQGLILSGYTFSGTSALIDCQTNLTGNYLRLGTGGANIGISNSSGTPVFISRNLNFDVTAASYKYNASAAASLIEVSNGTGYLKYAASGTAGNTVTPSTALTWDTNADITVTAGNLIINTVAKGISVKEGTNGKQGVATLVGGTVTVNTTSVTANSRIFAFCQTPGGTPGFLCISARVASTSFTILSSSGADTSVVAYEIFEPA